MPSSTSSPSQVLTNDERAALADRREDVARPSSAVSKTASTPSGTASRTAATSPSPRGSTTSAPKPRTNSSSCGAASARTRSPAPLRERDHVGGEQARAAGDERASHLRRGRGAPGRAARSGRSSAASPPARTWRPPGTGTTDAAGATRSSVCAPPSGRRGETTAITSSPTARPLDARPDRLDRRRRHPIPGTHGGGTPSMPRSPQRDVGRVAPRQP